jgi:hypothetical protein
MRQGRQSVGKRGSGDVYRTLRVQSLESRDLLSAAPLGPDFRVNTHTLLDQRQAAVASNSEGDFVVVWQSQAQDGSGLGIYAQRFQSDGLPQGGEFRVNSHTTGNQSSPSVAMAADGNFVVAWMSAGQDGSGGGIFAQRYDGDGLPQGGEFPVNSQTSGEQSLPTVAMDGNGDFVIAWESYGQDQSGLGIFAQRYDAAGAPQGTEVPVNSYVTADQSDPAVAMAADGSFVVTWQSSFQDGSSWGIYGQRFDATGSPAGGEFRANDYTPSYQIAPSVAMAADGGFVVAWSSVFQDASFDGVFARRYDSAGTPQGIEFQVNTFSAGQQNASSVAMNAGGDFLVAWQSDAQDGSGYGIYAQCYTPAALRKGSEFRVHSETSGAQVLPAVALDAAGDVVAAWHSYGQDGSGTGVYARRFRAAAGVVGRHLFYNQSKFDGGSAAIDASDDAAIAVDKAAYLPGSGPATFANISSYSRGINGIMIDIEDLEGPLSAADFRFRMSTQAGANNAPSTWETAPAPTAVSVRAGAGAGGADRVEITWANGAVQNRWLEVLVEGNDSAGEMNTNTGLATSDVLYFGSRIGDTGSGTATLAVTSAVDEIATRGNPGAGAAITNLFDFDRSGLVTATDNLIARGNAGTLTKINLAAPPPAPVAAGNFLPSQGLSERERPRLTSSSGPRSQSETRQTESRRASALPQEPLPVADLDQPSASRKGRPSGDAESKSENILDF